MRERGVDPTPENYQLFYAYASGENAQISRSVGELIAQQTPFTAQVLDGLREQHFTTGRLSTAVEDISAEVTSAVKSVMEKIAAAGKDTEAYGRKLTAASGELEADRSPEDLEKLVASLLGATKAMEVRTKTLEVELQKSSHEVTELRTKLDHVRRETLVDALTGIANRKAFDSELSEAVEQARASGEPLSLFMCDIDHFKSFNDTWGHQTGDQVLRLVAQCLSENVKGRDTAARYGGEEFAVIIRHTPLNGAITLANQIRTGVEAKRVVKKSTGDILGRITISIGVAELGPNDASDDLVERADACLYAAKNSGRNRVVGETQIIHQPKPNAAA